MKNYNFSAKKILNYGIACLLAVMSFTACSQKTGDSEEVVINDNIAVPRLLPGKMATGTQDESAQIVKTYNDAIAALKGNPDNLKEYLKLASVYITEGRITGNNGYYSNAAIKMLDKVISSKPDDINVLFESLSLKSAVLLNLHQFKQALEVAEQGKRLNAYDAGIYGALVDANVEMGNYAEAVKDCDQMLNIRPDLRSYSRASYLRQIYGDNKGAIDAMRMAVESGVPGKETTEWCRVNWGNLYLSTGHLDTAAMIYETALGFRPGYAPAEMGLAKVFAARKNYTAAITHAKNAVRVLSEAPYVTYLGELYRMQGQKDKAQDVFKDVLRLLKDSEKEQNSGNTAKHNSSRELALAYLNTGDYDNALKYATIDHDMRPNNIDVNDLMAWICYKKGDYTEARKYNRIVFQTKIRNADMLYKSGLIYAANGDAGTASRLKQEAIAVSPYIDAAYLQTSDN